MEITAKSESGFVITLPKDPRNRWVKRPAKWHGNKNHELNAQEEDGRYTKSPEEAQKWADELARVCR